MADTDDDDDLFGGNSEGDPKPKESGGGLRKQLEEALAKLKAAETKNADLEAKQKQHTIDQVFAELEVPEKVRKFYSGEPDKDKILEWVKDNADVFGLTVDSQESDEAKQQKNELKEVQKAGSVGFEGTDRAPETIAAKVLAGIRSGKMTEAEINAEVNKLFGR